MGSIVLSHLGEQLARPSRAGAVVDQATGATWLVTEEDVLGDGEGRDEAELLEDHADAEGSGVVGRADLDRRAVDRDLPFVRRVDPLQDLHQGRLAGAVAADQGVDLALAQVEIDPVQDADAGEALADPGHPDRDGVHRRHLELQSAVVEGAAVAPSTVPG